MLVCCDHTFTAASENPEDRGHLRRPLRCSYNLALIIPFYVCRADGKSNTSDIPEVAGNFACFVNHRCQPRSQFERFVRFGMQRIILVSKGIEAGKEINVDYLATCRKESTQWKVEQIACAKYLHNVDKVCRCGQSKCRYRDRDRTLLSPPVHEVAQRSIQIHDMLIIRTFKL